MLDGFQIVDKKESAKTSGSGFLMIASAFVLGNVFNTIIAKKDINQATIDKDNALKELEDAKSTVILTSRSFYQR